MGQGLRDAIGDRPGWAASDELAVFVLRPESWWAQLQPVPGWALPKDGWVVAIMPPDGFIGVTHTVGSVTDAVRLAEDRIAF